MQPYERPYPLFSLCGLNCGLCPRYHTSGSSQCPECGGPGFSDKHPSCTVLNCAKRHGCITYCFQCTDYPCERYTSPSSMDSFITYKHVIRDLEYARINGLQAYREKLDEKVEILKYLLEHCDDGRHKSRFCTAVNLLDLQDLREIKEAVSHAAARRDADLTRTTDTWLDRYTDIRGVSLTLRKQKS